MSLLSLFVYETIHRWEDCLSVRGFQSCVDLLRSVRRPPWRIGLLRRDPAVEHGALRQKLVGSARGGDSHLYHFSGNLL